MDHETMQALYQLFLGSTTLKGYLAGFLVGTVLGAGNGHEERNPPHSKDNYFANRPALQKAGIAVAFGTGSEYIINGISAAIGIPSFGTWGFQPEKKIIFDNDLGKVFEDDLGTIVGIAAGFFAGQALYKGISKIRDTLDFQVDLGNS